LHYDNNLLLFIEEFETLIYRIISIEIRKKNIFDLQYLRLRSYNLIINIKHKQLIIYCY